MKLEHESVEHLRSQILSVAKKHLDLGKVQVFFFGSRVSGRSNERSDIDLGILGDTSIPASAWLDLQEDLENIPMLYTIDPVDLGRVSPEFRRVAMQHVEGLL